jgi:CheY-specific phosphatase CheX
MGCERSSKVHDALLKSTQMTMMDMAFIDVIEAEEESEVHHSSVLYLDFTQPVRGGIIFRLSKECKMAIVENIHGSNWDSLSGDEIDDCLLEVLNVLAGNFLNLYCGQETGHNMSFPQMLFDEEEIPDGSEYVPYYFDAEGVVFRVDVCINQS